MFKKLTSYRCSRLAVVTVTMAMQAVVAAIGASPAFANYPYFVKSLADNVTPDGVCTLREAMFAANNNPITGDCGLGSPEFDTIFIFVPGTIVLEGKLPDITEGVHILGHADGGTTIDANGRTRAFVINSSGPLLGIYVTLERLTITSAKAPDGSVASPHGEDGGAIHNTGRLDLRDVRITHSAAGNGLAIVGNGGHGGAIYNAGGIVGYRVTFDNNSAGWGGAWAGGVNFNKGGSGGAIYNADGAALILYGATFMKNAEGRDLGFGAGAAVYTRGPAVIKSSTFLRNTGISTQFASTITAMGSGQVLLSTTIMDDF